MLTNTPGQDPSSPRMKRSFFKNEIIVTTHPKDSSSVSSVWGQQRDENWPKHMLHISATIDSPATFSIAFRTLLKCPLPFGCSAEGFGCNQWYLQALDDQGLYQQGWKGTFAHTSYAEVYWPLSPEAYEWKKKIQNLRMGHNDRRNPYLEFIYTGNKVGEELVYAVPSGWGMAVYPVFICTYPVELIKPAAIEVIYSKRDRDPLSALLLS